MGIVLLPGFDEDVDGLLDLLCCDKVDTYGLATFILTLLFVCSFHIHSGVNCTCLFCEYRIHTCTRGGSRGGPGVHGPPSPPKEGSRTPTPKIKNK